MASAAAASVKIKRIFSGIQPTGIPHLGNYLGAIRNWVKLQEASVANNDENIFCVVDLHSSTTQTDAFETRDNISNTVASLLACGIDPDKSLLFQQSQVPHHCSLAWILGCLAPIGQLKRMHQWKSKSGNEQDHANLGLFSYPVLMAADILLYRSTHVPVGSDQLQHIELTRDLTKLYNKKFGTLFSTPRPILTDTARVMSLRTPTHKMSKSDKSRNSRIDLNDSDDVITHKIRKAVTDSYPFISHDLSERHGVQNLVDILSALTDTPSSDIIERYEGVEYFTRLLKADTTEALIEHLRPIRNEYNKLVSDQVYLQTILNKGSEQANEIAQNTMKDVYKVVGMRNV